MRTRKELMADDGLQRMFMKEQNIITRTWSFAREDLTKNYRKYGEICGKDGIIFSVEQEKVSKVVSLSTTTNYLQTCCEEIENLKLSESCNV